MASKAIPVKVTEVAGQYRAQCPHCTQHRQHHDRKVALEYLLGHMVSTHHVPLSAVLSVK